MPLPRCSGSHPSRPHRSAAVAQAGGHVSEDLPTLVTTREAATLLKTKPAAVRVRVSRGQLTPVAQTTDGGLLFALTDIFDAPQNHRLHDKDVHAV